MKRLLLCAAIAAAGCSTTPDKPSTDPDWKSGEEAFLLGDWDRAIASYKRFLAAHASDDRVAEAHARIGRAWLGLGNPASALTSFDAALAADPDDLVAGDARLGRGMAYHALGSPPRAESEFVEALRVGGDRIRRDDALWFLGLSRIRQGKWDEGLADLLVLTKDYPDSPWAARARALRAAPERFFAVQVGAFSDPAGARARSEELRKKGYDPAIVPWDALHCVRVGRYPTWREAQAAAEEVAGATGLETAVVP